MDYDLLLDLGTELGYRLAMNGAETFRIEESVNRLMAAYGVSCETFAIPNCLHVSIKTADNQAMTRMRRIGYHGNDLDAVEKFSNLSRRLCAQTPELSVAFEWLKETERSRRYYPLYMQLAGNMLGACGFCILFGGSFVDCLLATLCGLVVGLVNTFMEHIKANQFFRIIAASFFMAFLAYFLGFVKLAQNPDTLIIGALMILVPGLVITNALRDIIYGDTNSGINRIVQVILVAAAIAVGTGAALNLADTLFHVPSVEPAIPHPLYIEAIGAFIGCVGFFIVFNIHGPGGFLCALGGVISWIAYRLTLQFSGSEVIAYFIATMVAALYSEILARIRKYPAISYLVISIFPLIPGAGVYYTTGYLVRGDMSGFAEKGAATLAIAGSMAVGILLISTIFRAISLFKQRKAA